MSDLIKLMRDHAMFSNEHTAHILREGAEALEKEERDAGAKQAEIDRLMLEFCPDEMTEQQLANWAAHQKPVSDDEAAAIDAARKEGT